SYGPGRYDPDYEECGQDYPLGFVRWTARRNFEAVLSMLADGRLDVTSLISHRLPFDQAVEAYTLLGEESTALGLVLQYPEAPETTSRSETVVLAAPPQVSQATAPALPVIGIIGAGKLRDTSAVTRPTRNTRAFEVHCFEQWNQRGTGRAQIRF